MKPTTSLTTLLLLATASSLVSTTPITKRQLSFFSSESSDLETGSCRPVTFIFARGSMEFGNMGSVVGSSTCSALRSVLGADAVACQGVGGAYQADFVSNALPEGTTQAAIDEATRLFKLATRQCPETQIVSGGYSQGAALVAAAVGSLDARTKARVKGVVLFGYTKNLQNGGKIPNYPASRTKVFCHASDAVCSGALMITAEHLTYGADAQRAARFLARAVQA